MLDFLIRLVLVVGGMGLFLTTIFCLWVGFRIVFHFKCECPHCHQALRVDL
jgi:hypothetical protein